MMSIARPGSGASNRSASVGYCAQPKASFAAAAQVAMKGVPNRRASLPALSKAAANASKTVGADTSLALSSKTSARKRVAPSPAGAKAAAQAVQSPAGARAAARVATKRNSSVPALQKSTPADAQCDPDAQCDQFQRGHLSMREGRPMGAGAVTAGEDAGGEPDAQCDQFQCGHLSMREGRPVGAGAVTAGEDAGGMPDAQCDQLQCGHLGMREGRPVEAGVVSAGEDAGGEPDAQCDQLQCGHPSMREGQFVEKFFPGSTKPCWNGMETIAIYNDRREIVKFKCNARPNLSFQEPVFFCSHGRWCSKQKKAQPMLLVCDTDWEKIKHFWLSRDFLGIWVEDEYEVWKHQRISANFVHGDYDPRGRDWIAVWTFPGDLNRLPGFNKLCYEGKLSTGCSTLTDDYWLVDRVKGYQSDDSMPISSTFMGSQKGALVEKFRQDMENGSPIHSLESAAGEKVAMISTSYFERSHLRGHHARATDEEQLNVRKLLRRLDALDIFAFACYTAHRALVFYADRCTGERITPALLADILHDPERGQEVISLLEEYAHDKEGLRSWSHNMIEWARGVSLVLIVHVGAPEGGVLPVSIKNLAGDELHAMRINSPLSVAELRALIVAIQPPGRKAFDLIGQDGQIMRDSWLVTPDTE